MTAMSSSTEDAPPIDRVLLDDELRPHRSLGQRGLVVVMTATCIVSFGAGLAFYLMGAWPVVGFLGLDVVLIYLALRVNLKRAQARERLRLTDSAMVIDRISHQGEIRRTTLQPYWLRVIHDADPDRPAPVMLASHGRGVIVGSFLPPVQRMELADRLRDALRRMREPRFDL